MKLKKFISVFLATVMCLTLLAPAIIAGAEKVCNCSDIPLIYVRGRSDVYSDKNDKTTHKFATSNDGEVEDMVKDILPAFAKAVVTNDYDEYCKQLVSTFSGFYSDFVLDENGNVTNNSGSAFTWSESTMPDLHQGMSNDTPEAAYYYVSRYFYQYDCRFSPCDIADDLHNYIEAVKKATGHSKVNILARCLGGNVASALFAEYGWDDINSVVFYNSIANGTAVNDSLFTGNISTDSDALMYFADQQLEETDLMNFLRVTIELYNKTYALKIPTAALNKIIAKIVAMAAPEMLINSYASMPGYWSMVSADKFEQAKAFVFGDQTQKYSGLISKIDEWQNTVALNLEDMYLKMAADGVHMNLITKYGFQLYPICEGVDRQSDMIVTAEQQSMGCTAAPVGKTLTKEYIQNAVQNGTDKYISPDKIIDASTGLFPDTTWYIKDFEHNSFPMIVDQLIVSILKNGGNTDVNSNPAYPQFMVYSGVENHGDQITPMTAENLGSTLEAPNIFTAIINMLMEVMKMVFAALKAVQANSAAM